MQTAELLALPLAQWLMAMEALWESLCRDPIQSQAIPDWHQTELTRRLAALDSGQEIASPWDDAKERIRHRAKQLV